ncbi:MAG: hypothetical protein ACI9YT_000052 [Halobacteriales archaeon]|jgi:hypothetical protein
MKFFRDVGKRVERFKQEVEDVAKDEAEYECSECGELVYADREDCPECGAVAVVARTPETEGEPANGESEGTGADGSSPGAGDSGSDRGDAPPE